MATEKRILDTHTFWASHIIFDIEGTTTSISFVKDTLFPYIRKHLDQYVNDSWKDESFQSVVTALREQAKSDENDGLEGFVAIPEGDSDEVKNAVIKNVLWQMDNDRKTKSLKDLQSLVMTNGYKTGNIVGHIYDDVDTNLKAWKDQGKLLYIYSSGSVNAQKLLFGNTNKGNLLNLFSGHFDTVVGPKTESSSYRKILDEIKSEPGDVLFFTDIPAEAKAAVGAGLQAVLVSRDGNAPVSDQDRIDFTVINSFSDIEFEQSTKKRKMLNDTNCDIVIENKDVEHGSTYISETVSGESGGQIKPDISVDTDVDMVEVEEKAVCIGNSKDETKLTEEDTSCKEIDVDLKMQSDTELIKDNIKQSESLDKNTEMSSKNEINRSIAENPDVKVKNDVEIKKDNVAEKKIDDKCIEEKKCDVEDVKEHDVEGKKEQDSLVVVQKNKCPTNNEVSKQSSVTDSSDKMVKAAEELNDNTIELNKELSTNGENGKVESENSGNEIKKSVDNSDKNEIDLCGTSEIQEEVAVKLHEEKRNVIGPVINDNVETAQTNKTAIDCTEMNNVSENNTFGLSDGTNKVEKEQREAGNVKEIGNEKDNHAVSITVDGGDVEDNVKECEKTDAVSCSASDTARVKTAENTAVEIVGNNVVSNATIDKISENVSNITTVENAVPNATVVEMTENVTTNTTAAENVVSKTIDVEIAENVIPDTTPAEITENVSNTTVVEIAENVTTDITAAQNSVVSKTTAVEDVLDTTPTEIADVISNTTATTTSVSKSTEVKIAKNVIPDTTSAEITENVSNLIVNEIAGNISNTTAVEVAENTVSNITGVKIVENAVSTTAVVEITENVVEIPAVEKNAENSGDTDQPMEVSESKEDIECKSDVLSCEGSKHLSNEKIVMQNNESEQKMIIDEVTTESNGTSVGYLSKKEMTEKENYAKKETEPQEKIIIENRICSKMETENCDVVSNTCEKDNTVNKKTEVTETINDSIIEIKEESKTLNESEVSSDNDKSEKENNEESTKTENNRKVAVCINNVDETKPECSDVCVEKISTNHEEKNVRDVKEKEDVTDTAMTVGGKYAENNSCSIEKNKDNVDKPELEVTTNGDAHENTKTDDEKTDNINEKTESNTVVNGGTENVVDSVPEVKKVISDAANSSTLEAVSQPV